MSDITVQELAKTYYDLFEAKIQIAGGKFYTLKDEAPDELTELVHTAHRDMLPDNWRYETIMHCIAAFIYCSNHDDAEPPEPNVHTCELIKWVGSYGTRQDYVDEAFETFRWPEGGFSTLLMHAQALEISEVFYIVKHELESIVEELKDEECAAILDTVDDTFDERG